MNELIDLNELLQVLMDLAKDVEENYKEHLVNSGRYTTNYALIDSVKTQVVAGENSYEVTLTLNDYWKYVENDTKPHFPPSSAILNWIEVKPIIPRPDSHGKIPRPEQLAFLIGRKIAREGTEGSHDLQITKDNIIPWYKERIATALGHDMENYIRKIIKE